MYVRCAVEGATCNATRQAFKRCENIKLGDSRRSEKVVQLVVWCIQCRGYHRRDHVMKIVWLITAGSLLLSVATSENDVPVENNVQRVPRALILQPVIKVKSKDDDEGPFDFISDWLSRIINPPKKTAPPQQPPMLGPIHVPGVNDQVFIKQLTPMPHRNSRVVIKMPNNGLNNMPMSMPSAINSYQKQNYPVTPARQVPMQSGFYPLPTQNSNVPWSPITSQPYYTPVYTNNIHDSSNSMKNGYNNHPNHLRNFRNIPGYQNNLVPNQNNQQQNYYSRYTQQWQPHPQQYYPPYQWGPQPYSPYDPRYRPYTGYGGNDIYNSIPGTGGRFSNYGVDSSGSMNYSRHPPHQHSYDTTTNEENEASKDEEDEEEENNDSDKSREREEIIKKTKFKNVQLPKVNPTSTKVSTNPAELIEIYRSDRMVPTNPTYRNRFWTRVSKTTNKITTTTESYRDGQAEESTKNERKYSSREIQEIPAPNLKAWKEAIDYEKDDEQNSDLRMDDEDGIVMKDGTTLGKGESREHTDKATSSINDSTSDSINSDSSSDNSSSSISKNSDNSSIREQLESSEPSNNISKITSRISRNWKPMEPSKRKENIETSNSTEVQTTMPEVSKKSRSLTASHSRRHHDTKKPSKRKLPRFKNSNRRVRVVESVRSSVSMTSSKGVKKPKIKI